MIYLGKRLSTGSTNLLSAGFYSNFRPRPEHNIGQIQSTEEQHLKRQPSYEELEVRVKQLEAALSSGDTPHRDTIKELSEELKKIIERSHDGIYQFDLESRKFQFFNQRFLSFFGIEEKGKKVLSTNSVRHHIHPDDLEKIKRARSVSLKPGREDGEVEYRLLHTDGTTRWMHDRWSVVRDNRGKAISIEGFVRDNTQRKQAEDELERSRNNALIGSYILEGGRFVQVNPEFQRITGYSRNELLGMPAITLVHPTYRESVKGNAVKMLKGQRDTPYEFCVIDKKGGVKWIMETVSAIKYEGRRAALGYFMDITGSKKAEQERLEKEKLQTVLEMAGAVGHELNSPLQVVLTCSKKLSKTDLNDQLRRQLIHLLQEHVGKMVILSQKIQDISTYAAKNYVGGKTIIDIHAASEKRDLPTEPHRNTRTKKKHET